MSASTLPTLARAAADALLVLADTRRAALSSPTDRGSALYCLPVDRGAAAAAMDALDGAIRRLRPADVSPLPGEPERTQIVALGAEGADDDEAWAEELRRWAAEIEAPPAPDGEE